VFGPSLSGVERTLLPMKEIRRGDVIVFKYPEDPERDFIKRVIGLPGEQIEVRHKRVYVDGSLLDEPYAHYMEEPPPVPQEIEPDGDRQGLSGDPRENYGPVAVPPKHYFVMGDNRDNSQDSRYWSFLPRDYVKGRALMIYWSYESEREDYLAEGAGATLRRMFSVVTHFFTKTRWERLFQRIH
jgi:signal peptidase I